MTWADAFLHHSKTELTLNFYFRVVWYLYPPASEASRDVANLFGNFFWMTWILNYFFAIQMIVHFRLKNKLVYSKGRRHKRIRENWGKMTSQIVIYDETSWRCSVAMHPIACFRHELFQSKIWQSKPPSQTSLDN